MSTVGNQSTKVTTAAAITVAALGVGLAFWLLKGKGTEGRCPFSGATSTSSDHVGCPHSTRTTHEDHFHVPSHGHGSCPGKVVAAALKAQLASTLPFQPRSFSPNMLLRCTGANEDPLGLLKGASVTDTKNITTTSQKQLEDDLAFTHNMVCISAKGIVYKVTPQFYGPGEPYAVYAGKEISRCLAIGQVDDAEACLPWSQNSSDAFKHFYSTYTPMIDMSEKILKAMADKEPYDGEFTAEELQSLDLWTQKYDKKYQVVGWYAPFAFVNEPPSTVCHTTKEVANVVAQRVSVKPSLTAEEVDSPHRPITTRRGAGGVKSEAPPSEVLRTIKV